MVIRQDVLEAVARGVAQGEYSLLLGAGASVSAVGGNGKPLPTGAGLRDALVNDFGLETDGEQLPLTTVYGTLKRLQGPSVGCLSAGVVHQMPAGLAAPFGRV